MGRRVETDALENRFDILKRMPSLKLQDGGSNTNGAFADDSSVRNERNVPEHSGRAAVTALAKLGNAQVARNSAAMWQAKVQKAHQMIEIHSMTLGHLNDCFIRADTRAIGSVDLHEFVNSFKQVFPPWRYPVDANVSVAVLKSLFIKVDSNDDGRLTWEEFSSYVLQESMHMSLTGVTGLQISLFLEKLPDDPYTDESAYHKEMINSVRAVSVQVGNELFVKYITCGRDGSFRVWSAQTRRHITTVHDSTRQPAAWVTCCIDLPELTTPRNTAGVLAVFSLERTMTIYDLNNFSKVNSFHLGDGVVPLCCDAFSHTETVKGRLSRVQQIVLGDIEGRLHLFPQNLSLINDASSKAPAATVIKVHTMEVTQCAYVPGIDKIVSTSADSTVCLCDPVDHSLRYFRGHEKNVQCFAFCEPNKYIATGGQERVILLWNPYTLRRITGLIGHASRIQNIVFNSSQNHIISLAKDKEVIVWDPKSFEMLFRVTDNKAYRPENTFSAMCWDHRKNRLVLANTRVHVWPYRGEMSHIGNVLHKTRIVSVVINPVFDSTVTIDFDGLVLIWSTEDGRQVNAFSCDGLSGSTKVTSAKFDVSWRRLYIGDATGRVRIFNWHNGVCINELVSDANTEISCIDNAASKTRRYTLAAGWNRVLYIWKDPPESYKQPLHSKIDPGCDSDILSMTCIAPNTVAVGMYDGTVVAWESDGSWKKKLKLHASRCQDKDGGFEGRDSLGINCMSHVLLQGKVPYIVTASMDGYLRLWDAMDGEKKGEFDCRHLDEIVQRDGTRKRLPVVAMSIDPHRKKAVTGDNIGQVKTFELSEALYENVTLKVTVIEAKDILAADANGFSDPYAHLELGKSKFTTTTQMRTLNPIWNESFNLPVGSGRHKDVLKDAGNLFVTIFDFDKYAQDDELGMMVIPLRSLDVGYVSEAWYDLSSCDDDFPNRLCGKIKIRLEMDVVWNNPPPLFEWRAHDDSIHTIVTLQSQVSSYMNGLIITAGLDNKVHLWTSNGGFIGKIGHGGWDMQSILNVQRQTAMEKAAQLFYKDPGETDQSSSKASLQGEASRQKQGEGSTKDMTRKEHKENVAADSEDLEHKQSMGGVKRGHSARAVSTKSPVDIPDNSYDVLSRPLLDSILERRGHLPEDLSLVFTRMHIEGLSDRLSDIKAAKIHTWDMQRLKELGLIEQRRVQYGMVDVDAIEWNNGDPERREKIIQRPQGTVASVYRQEQGEGGTQQANGREEDVKERTKSPTQKGEASKEHEAGSAKGSDAAAARGASHKSYAYDVRKANQPKHGVARDPNEARGVTDNVWKLFSSSLPPHRPQASWEYMKDEVRAGRRSRSRTTPRFDAEEYMRLHVAPPPMLSLFGSAKASPPKSMYPCGWVSGGPPSQGEWGGDWIQHDAQQNIKNSSEDEGLNVDETLGLSLDDSERWRTPSRDSRHTSAHQLSTSGLHEDNMTAARANVQKDERRSTSDAHKQHGSPNMNDAIRTSHQHAAANSDKQMRPPSGKVWSTPPRKDFSPGQGSWDARARTPRGQRVLDQTQSAGRLQGLEGSGRDTEGRRAEGSMYGRLQLHLAVERTHQVQGASEVDSVRHSPEGSTAWRPSTARARLQSASRDSNEAHSSQESGFQSNRCMTARGPPKSGGFILRMPPSTRPSSAVARPPAPATSVLGVAAPPPSSTSVPYASSSSLLDKATSVKHASLVPSSDSQTNPAARARAFVAAPLPSPRVVLSNQRDHTAVPHLASNNMVHQGARAQAVESATWMTPPRDANAVTARTREPVPPAAPFTPRAGVHTVRAIRPHT